MILCHILPERKGWVNRITLKGVWALTLYFTHCIPWRRIRTLKMGVLDMTLNWFWCWESSSGDLESTEYSFIAITHRSTLIRSGSTCVWIPSTTSSFLLMICVWWDRVQKTWKLLYKRCKHERTMNAILPFLTIK